MKSVNVIYMTDTCDWFFRARSWLVTMSSTSKQSPQMIVFWCVNVFGLLLNKVHSHRLADFIAFVRGIYFRFTCYALISSSGRHVMHAILGSPFREIRHLFPFFCYVHTMQYAGVLKLPDTPSHFSVDDPAGASSQQREECRSSGRSAGAAGGVPVGKQELIQSEFACIFFPIFAHCALPRTPFATPLTSTNFVYIFWHILIKNRLEV